MDEKIEKLRARLRDDFSFYAPVALKVVSNQKTVPFRLRPAQQKLEDALEKRRAEGRPQRAIILKARKMGFSTHVQGKLLQRTTLRPNHNALVVAQDLSTAGELAAIGEFMYNNLPSGGDWDLLGLKPEKVFERRQKQMHFGQRDRARRAQGDIGLNSRLVVDTANEVEGGRGFTNHSVHLSECAFYENLAKKLTSILNTVPQDDPDTLVILESTANGHNEFKETWDRAEAGENDYIPFFAAWFEDPRYTRRFISAEEQGEFQSLLGEGPMGEDEPYLLEQGLTLEQLNWRRWAIANLAGGDLSVFRQEYPSTPAEAFQTTGRQVFLPALVQLARQRAEVTDKEAEQVTLHVKKSVTRRGRFVTLDVPTETEVREWGGRGRADVWSIWERPRDRGQYVIVVDPAQGEENTSGESDFTAIQVLDHKLRVQVAQMQTRSDADLVAQQAFLACLLFTVGTHKPLLVVEMTGGYGTSIANRIWREYGYNRMYFRRPVDPRKREHQSDLVGFSTDRHTKPALVDGLKELLRERSHGVKSLQLVRQMEGYTRTKTGKMEAPAGGFDDLLMAYMIAQYVAQERPPRPDQARGPVTARRYVLNPTTGY